LKEAQENVIRRVGLSNGVAGENELPELIAVGLRQDAPESVGILGFIGLVGLVLI